MTAWGSSTWDRGTSSFKRMDPHRYLVGWMEQFAQCVKPTREHTILLLLGGHFHIHKKHRCNGQCLWKRDCEAYFPSRSRHKTQSHDVWFIRPFGESYNRDTKEWFWNNPERIAYRQDLDSSLPSVSDIESRNFCIFQNRNLCHSPKLEDHPLSALRNCLFNIFAAILRIGDRSSIRKLRTRHGVVRGTHL